VSEITLGQAKKNVESGMMLDAKEASAKLQREAAAARYRALCCFGNARAEREKQCGYIRASRSYCLSALRTPRRPQRR